MKDVLIVWLPGVLGLAWLSAAPTIEPREWLRQGNAAFARQNYQEALKLYDRAAEHTTEPGLVAFNRAAALYRLEQYAEAEASYRECLSDATDLRRARALFGLGNCLVQQSGARGAKPLLQAVACYRECLRQAGLDPILVEDVQHNLELAKLLLLTAKASAPDKSDKPNDPEHDHPNPNPARHDTDRNPGSDGMGGPRPGQAVGRGQAELRPGDEAGGTDQQPGGAGNLPPIPDKGELVPLPPAIAAALLKQAGDRVLDAGQQRDKRGKDPVGVLDR